MGNTETLSYIILGAFAFLMLAGTINGVINARRQATAPISPDLQMQFDLLRAQMRLEARESEIKRYQEALAGCRGLVAQKLGNEGLSILDSQVTILGDAMGGNKTETK